MSARFRIGDLTLDTGRRLLIRDSKPVALGPLTYAACNGRRGWDDQMLDHLEAILEPRA